MGKNTARDERARINRPKQTLCLHCNGVIEVPPKGRIKKYCNQNCKSLYHADTPKRVDWENSNVDRRMYYRCKSRAKVLGLPFDLTLQDCQIPEYCPVLGVKLEYRKGQGYNPYTPSMDKIIPERGYVKGNVRVISWKANLIKNDATLEELRLVYEDYKQLLEEVAFDV